MGLSNRVKQKLSTHLNKISLFYLIGIYMTQINNFRQNKVCIKKW